MSEEILAELINEGERIVGQTNSGDIPSSTTSSGSPSFQVDEIILWYIAATIITFIVMKVVFGKWFIKGDDFGEPYFNVKKYIGISALFSLFACGLVWYYKRVYVKKGVTFSE